MLADGVEVDGRAMSRNGGDDAGEVRGGEEFCEEEGESAEVVRDSGGVYVKGELETVEGMEFRDSFDERPRDGTGGVS